MPLTVWLWEASMFSRPDSEPSTLDGVLFPNCAVLENTPVVVPLNPKVSAIGPAEPVRLAVLVVPLNVCECDGIWLVLSVIVSAPPVLPGL